MSSFLANRSLTFKLALVCWVPVLALLAISLHDISAAYRSTEAAKSIQQVLEVAPVMSDLVHDLQRERGTSAGFVGSNGLAFGGRLDGLRSGTDSRVTAVEATLGNPKEKLSDPAFTAPYDRAMGRLEKLGTVRARVDAREISVDVLANYYSTVIADLLEAIENMKLNVDNSDALRPISAFIALLHAKEHAGLERAMGAVGFGSGSFDSETYERFVSLIAKQEHLLSQFRKHAPAEALLLSSKLRTGPFELKVQTYRDIARAAPFGGDLSSVSGSDWWRATTDRIDALKEIEDRLSQSLYAQAVKASHEASLSFMVLAAVLSATIIGAGLVSVLVYREIEPPIGHIVSSMCDWSQGKEISDLREAQRKDELGELARAFNDLRSRLEQTRMAEKERTDRERALTLEMKLLSDLNEWLQSSTSTDELYTMIGAFMTRLLPDCSGSVYVYSNSRDVLDGTCAWNGGILHEHIRPDDCWSLRRGRGYSYKTDEIKFACEHTKPHEGGPYSCLPILAHGETVGMMHLKPLEAVSEEDFFASYRLAQQAAEQISLAIANSKMRDQLHQQSIRDPLTGLFNRRHFIDALRRCVEASKRNQAPFVLASIDVDHFKRFNDNHGHDAGDMVLRAVGSALEKECDRDELPCRIGGEEFMLLLPETTLTEGQMRADQIRQAIEKIAVRYGEKTLPKITISVGVSGYPDHGSLPQDLMKTADDALYKSKAAGRNQVTVASMAEDETAADAVDFEKVKQELAGQMSPPERESSATA